jgi:hypothetical protein
LLLGEIGKTQRKIGNGEEPLFKFVEAMLAFQVKPKVPTPKMGSKALVKGLRALYQTRTEHAKMTEPTKPVPVQQHRGSIPSSGLEQ